MAKSVSYNKREIEKKKQEKRLEKQKRKEERKANAGSGSLDGVRSMVSPIRGLQMPWCVRHQVC